jgi:hypothetical protein
LPPDRIAAQGSARSAHAPSPALRAATRAIALAAAAGDEPAAPSR